MSGWPAASRGPGCATTTAVAVDLLDGVDDGHAGHDRVVSLAHGRDEPVEERQPGEAAGGVVDEHDVDVGPQAARPAATESRALRPTGDDRDIGGTGVRRHERARLPEVGGGRDDDDL